MAITRSATAKGGPAKVTWNSCVMETQDDIVVPMGAKLQDVVCSQFGVIDKVATDVVLKIPLRLWGAVKDIATLFPAAAMTPVLGTRIFGSTDLPLTILATNNDQIIFKNAQITKLANLYLGIDKPIFAADIEFTALIATNKNPEEAGAYIDDTVGAWVADTAFDKTKYLLQRYSAVWTGRTGFTAFQAKLGWDIGWEMELEPEVSSNIGTYDMILTGFQATAKCIPITTIDAAMMSSISAQTFFKNGTTEGLGQLASSFGDGAADLIITGAAATPNILTITLKNAFIESNTWMFGIKPYRQGEVMWRTTTAVTTGVAAARAAFAQT